MAIPITVMFTHATCELARNNNCVPLHPKKKNSFRSSVVYKSVQTRFGPLINLVVPYAKIPQTSKYALTLDTLINYFTNTPLIWDFFPTKQLAFQSLALSKSFIHSVHSLSYDSSTTFSNPISPKSAL